MARPLLPFYPELPKCSTFDMSCARMLVKAIQRAACNMRSYSIKAWAIHFTKLRILDKITEDRISSALQWLSDNIEDQYTPVIRSGRSFRDKFSRLESSMERTKRHTRADENKLSPDEMW